MTPQPKRVASTLRDEAQVPIRALDIKPPRWGSSDEEIEHALKQPFTAYELAMRRGHHPKLWQAVKGSPFQTHYELRFGPQSYDAQNLTDG